jgi:hypothetical protein
MKYHSILLELLTLRDTDYDLFLDKLYEAITGEFEKAFIEEFTKDKNHKDILDQMIKHFELKEEFEKCKRLLEFYNYQ